MWTRRCALSEKSLSDSDCRYLPKYLMDRGMTGHASAAQRGSSVGDWMNHDVTPSMILNDI